MNWNSIKYKLPEEEKDYLTYIMDNGCSYRMEVQKFYKKQRVLEGMYKYSFTHWELTTHDDHIVTHWMSLPKEPVEECKHGHYHKGNVGEAEDFWNCDICNALIKKVDY